MSDQHKQDDYYAGFKPSEATKNAHGSRSAENNCQYMLPTLLQMAADKPNLRILDVGCGPGSITVSLAQYIPQGQIIGVDLSETVLEKANGLAREQQVANVSFQVANAYELPFEDGSCDIVHTSQAVVHLSEHSRAIREFARVTRKGGGVVCMREADTYTAAFYPRDPVLEDSWQRFIRVNETMDIQWDGGRRLKDWTVQAGIPAASIEFTAGSWCFHTLEQRRDFNGLRFWQGASADNAVESGVATR